MQSSRDFPEKKVFGHTDFGIPLLLLTCSVSWNSIAFSSASARFCSLLAYMAVMFSQAWSRSSMWRRSSGRSASPTRPATE